MERENQIKEGLDLMGIGWTEDQVQSLVKYLDEILLWNPTHGLISGEGGSREAPPDLIPRHLFDSLSALPYLQGLNPKTMADIGSGAGLPGIPLAIFLPQTSVTLVEKQKRRCNFLRNVVAVLGLKDRVIIEQRNMEVIKENFDLVTLRAFASLPGVYKDLKKLIAPGGHIAAFKGTRAKADEEMNLLDAIPDPPVRMEAVSLKVPFLEAERHLVVLNP